VLLDLLENLSSKDDDGSRTVSDFGILGASDIDEDAGGGVDNVEKLSESQRVFYMSE
jgi:hypothetical protein